MPSLRDSFELGKAQAKQWKEQFDNSQRLADVFEENFIEKIPSAIFQTKETHALSTILGKRWEMEIPLVVVGPRGSGKTTAARVIAHDLEFVKYKAYNPDFWEWWDNWDNKGGNTKILIFDNVYPIWRNLTLQSFLDLKERASHHRVRVAVIINTFEYYWLRQDSAMTIFGQKPQIHHFPRPKKNQVYEILMRRMNGLKQSNPFSSEVLKAIATFSFGLPGLALWIVRRILERAPTLGNSVEFEKIELSDLLRWLRQLSFTPALKLLGRSQQFVDDIEMVEKLEVKDENISFLGSPLKPFSESQTTILDQMLILNQETGTIQRSELQTRTGIKESSLTYSCQGLVQEKLVSYVKAGREVKYQLNSPIKEALELVFAEKHK